MSLARSGGGILPPSTAAILKQRPVPEYLNLVGKLSEVRIGARPCRSPNPKKVMRHDRSITMGMRLCKIAREAGYDKSVVMPIAKYASILRLSRSAKGPLRSTPSTSPIRLKKLIVAVLANGLTAKRMKEI